MSPVPSPLFSLSLACEILRKVLREFHEREKEKTCGEWARNMADCTGSVQRVAGTTWVHTERKTTATTTRKEVTYNVCVRSALGGDKQCPMTEPGVPEQLRPPLNSGPRSHHTWTHTTRVSPHNVWRPHRVCCPWGSLSGHGDGLLPPHACDGRMGQGDSPPTTDTISEKREYWDGSLEPAPGSRRPRCGSGCGHRPYRGIGSDPW